jgi:hypothetical protein
MREKGGKGEEGEDKRLAPLPSHRLFNLEKASDKMLKK